MKDKKISLEVFLALQSANVARLTKELRKGTDGNKLLEIYDELQGKLRLRVDVSIPSIIENKTKK